MTQTSQTKPENKINDKASLGAAAAAAATGAKPDDKTAKPVDPNTAKATTSAAAAATDADKGEDGDDDKEGEGEGKKKGGSRIFIAIGEVHEFETAAKAEKFLNGDGAPATYAVLRGKRIGTSKKVSLR
jgi:hypothetical protein